MAYNKFIKKDGSIMLDLTDTTVSAETLGKNITAVDKYGNKITGTGTLADSPLPIEVSTEEEMNALLENGEAGGVYKYVGDSGIYEKYALYILKDTSAFAYSDGYYITDADGTILVPKGDVEIAKLFNREDLTKYFEGEHHTIDLSYIVKLKNHAFYNDNILSHIIIPHVISIGDYAFYGCKNLALTELPSGITSIGNYVFNGCKNLALTELPSGITSIGERAFYRCSNLALTELPSGITDIGEYAFSWCYNLALTKLPSGLTNIGNSTFVYCHNLALTKLPDGITSIGYNAFEGCTKLALTELPSGLTSIKSYAFEGCAGLTNLTFKSTVDKIEYISSYAFDNCPNLLTINVPWARGEVKNAPWGATKATINYGKLSAPTLSLDGTVLTITDRDGRATSFDILVDGEVKTTIAIATFDLSTLGLASGTYSVTAIAKTEGLNSSSASSTVEYIVS